MVNVKRAPFSFRVNNATDIFYELVAYIKPSVRQPLSPVCSNTNSVVVTGSGETACQLARELLARPIGTKPMKSMLLALFTVIAAAISASANPGQNLDQSQKPTSVQKQQEKVATMTGCI